MVIDLTSPVMRITLLLCLIPLIILTISPRVTSKSCGEPCPAGAFPYIVSIETAIVYRHVCGGSLLRPKWVLTCAHCMNSDGTRYVVVAGLSALMYKQDYTKQDYTNPDSIQEAEVLRWYSHPGYILPILANDICLVRLKTSIHETPIIERIVLHLEEFPPSFETDCANSLVLGFGERGKKEDLVGKKKIARRLTCANLTVLSDYDCLFLAHSTQFCAVDKNKVPNCLRPGDSGGPLICNGKQIGIASGLYKGTQYNLFVRLYLYKEFIHDILASSGNKFRLSITCALLDVFFLINNKLFY